MLPTTVYSQYFSTILPGFDFQELTNDLNILGEIANVYA